MDCCRIKLFESTVYERYRIYFSVSPSFPSSWHLLFKVNNQNTRKMRGFYSELKIKNLSIVSCAVVVFSLLTLNNE